MPTVTSKVPDELYLKILEYGRGHGIMRRVLKGTKDQKDIPNVDSTVRTILGEFFSPDAFKVRQEEFNRKLKDNLP
jgi:hypothetical protein